ncbi:universal stress protein [Amycolatopsis acidicola]|uniref:Universal stress protein n=1 Tax=Amycolatopsis acidicola TaxID=2596893 RepID=A0A5N0UUN6_9PSEU|nr:universal stress protein [Amycolatopsis acidicola]KAA9153465.1 universal stress protein [Amycolatopsis acidicola]
MSGQGTIVVGVDGSKSSEAALRWAVAEAAATRRDVLVMTAWSQVVAADAGAPGQPVDDLVAAHRAAQQKVLEAVARPDVTIRGEIVEGDPTDVLLTASDGADLLVLGTHGRGAVMRTLLGSVSARCLRKANCPVVVLPLRAVAPEGTATHEAAAMDYAPGPVL